MAERVVSPGVFTRERDLSFLEQGVANIGAAFVGVTQKGPAFVPVIVDSQTEFESRFGKADEYSYLGYTVQNYLQEAQSATVVRVLGLDGYAGSGSKSVKLVASGSGGQRVVAIFHPTTSGSSITSASITADTTASGADNMTINLMSTTSVTTSSFTGVKTSKHNSANIRNSIGTSPFGSANGYTYSYFPDAVDTTRGGITFASMSLDTSPADIVDFSGQQYANAATPWIRSQLIGGSRHNCFKVHTLTDGSNSNKAVKISIRSIKPQVESGSFGTFDLLVRDGDDTDAKPEVLEEYLNVNLDTNSSDYIARRVGDSAPFTDNVDSTYPKMFYQGDYSNKSKFIRVQMSPSAASLPEVAVPYGFAAISTPHSSSAATVTPPLVIDSAWVSGSVTGYSATSTRNVNKYYGYDYTSTNYTNLSYLSPVSNGAATVTYIPEKSSSAHVPATVTEFSLDNLRSNEVGGTADVSLSTSSHVTYRKFTVPMQGGFDGFKPHRSRLTGVDIVSTNTQGFDCSDSTKEGSRAFKKALDSIRDPESHDINLLVIPGVNYEQHPYVCQYAVDLVEDRQDCFYIMDLASCPASIATAIEKAGALDTNYAAGWYPWVKVLNTNTNKFIWAPPSVVLPEVFAYNDNVAAEWFAPAGLNRGGIPGATQVKSRLARANRDELYENKVNPIAAFPGQGIVAFGQKTLQKKASALDRINVRRLLIALKKFVASSSRYLVFEQNTEATRQRFLNIVNPYLASVQERQGLYAFRVVMDETNNTPDVIDRNQLVGQIYLQPARAAEFIIVDFNIMPTGATFPGS